MKSLIFNAEDVLAWKAGSKKLHVVRWQQPELGTDCPYHVGAGKDRKARVLPFHPGEKVYIREAWHCDNPAAAQDVFSHGAGLFYKTGMEEWEQSLFVRCWKKAITMPEWAARFHAIIKSVRPEEVGGVWYWKIELEKGE